MNTDGGVMSYAFSPRSACIAHGMQNNHVIHCPMDNYRSRGARARCRSSQPASLGLLRTRFSRKTRWNSSEVSVLSRMSTSAWREKGPTCTIASRAWAAVTPSPRDCRPVTTDTLPLVLLGPPQFQLLPGPLILQ